MVFTDASAKAYAAIVYLRSMTTDGNVTCNLVFAKTRLAPTNKSVRPQIHNVSLPRMELLGVLIGVRALVFVRTQLDIKIDQSILWTDSACVLQWLHTSKPLPRFVSNRITEINSVQGVSFRYVITTSNPADIPSHGCQSQDLIGNTFWWNGPQWLLQDPTMWPTWTTPTITEVEIEPVTATLTPTVPQVANIMGIDGQTFKSLDKLLRISAICLKFIQKRVWNQLPLNRQNTMQSTYPLFASVMDGLSDNPTTTAKDLRFANCIWVRQIQQNNFTQVFCDILAGRTNTLQRQLGLCLDIHVHHLLRCQGRRLFSVDAQCPALLTRHHWFTDLVIRDRHLRTLHAGVEHTLSRLRTAFWIPKGRATVKAALTQCVTCRRYQGPSFALPSMPPLPKERVTQSDPFTFVGIDYFGPIQIRDTTTTSVTKIWVCLFICLAVRAVHLECVRSLSTLHFLQCLQRFVARRGVPQLVISDNASQFTLAASVLNLNFRSNVLESDQVAAYLATAGITWKFTTQCAPWQGGIYERLIGLLKTTLAKIIGRQVLDYDQLVTTLLEAEAMVNSRPLIHVPVDEENLDYMVLTPGHFVHRARPVAMPVPDDVEYDEDFVMSLSKTEANSLRTSSGK